MKNLHEFCGYFAEKVSKQPKLNISHRIKK